jgi:hypothetical protein
MQLLGKPVGQMAYEGQYRDDVQMLATDGIAMLKVRLRCCNFKLLQAKLHS